MQSSLDNHMYIDVRKFPKYLELTLASYSDTSTSLSTVCALKPPPCTYFLSVHLSSLSLSQVDPQVCPSLKSAPLKFLLKFLSLKFVTLSSFFISARIFVPVQYRIHNMQDCGTLRGAARHLMRMLQSSMRTGLASTRAAQLAFASDDKRSRPCARTLSQNVSTTLHKSHTSQNEPKCLRGSLECYTPVYIFAQLAMWSRPSHMVITYATQADAMYGFHDLNGALE